ncbi:MAG: exonuclease SbcCD subunit D [Actinomycetes bacterium]
MKILHTSDWHLGRKFVNEDLLATQSDFVDWLVETVRTEKIELVAIAGDVYDRSVPPEEAVALLGRALDDIASTGAQVVMIPGNHDNTTRLGFGERAFGLAGIHIRGSIKPERAGAPFFLDFADGPLAVVAVPFLDPGMYFVRGADGEYPESKFERTHEGALQDAIQTAHSTISERGTKRSLILSHAFVAGDIDSSDSEKVLRVGGTDRVSLNVFEGFSYAALGHIHKPYSFEENRISYSGSPIPYSFSEEAQKIVRIIEMAPDGSIEVEERAVPIGRRVATITGLLADLLKEEKHSHAADCWVRAILTDNEVRLNPMAQLRTRFPHTIAIENSALDARSQTGGPDVEKIDSLTDEELAEHYWLDVREEKLEGEYRSLLVDAIIAEKEAAQ